MDKKLKIISLVLFVAISLFNANAKEIQDSNALDSLPIYSIYLQKPLNGNIYADTHGVALTDSIICLDSASVLSLTAIPDSGFQFVQWHDLDTHAIRTISIIKDTLLSALFDSIPMYEPIFGKESTVYNILSLWTNAETNEIKNLKNTVVNGISYTTFRRDGGGDYFIRANKNNSVVYQLIDTTEDVVMDLNMKIGDSFSIRQDPNTMFRVDSVFYANERKHIRLQAYQSSLIVGDLFFIEGIGTNIGLFYRNRFYAAYSILLLCAYKDGEHIYTNTYFDGTKYEKNCFVYITLNTELMSKSTSISLSPNPASTQLNIEIPQIPNGNKKEVAIYDMQGRKKLKQIFTENSLSLDISAFSKGLYILQITDLSTHAKIQQKWIKN